jgi:hypothetical protein
MVNRDLLPQECVAPERVVHDSYMDFEGAMEERHAALRAEDQMRVVCDAIQGPRWVGNSSRSNGSQEEERVADMVRLGQDLLTLLILMVETALW